VALRVTGVLFLSALLLGTVSPAGAADNAPSKKPSDLEMELVKTCQDICEGFQQDMRDRKRTPTEGYCKWSCRWLEAAKAVAQKPADRLAAYKAHWERMKDAEKLARGKYDAGRMTLVNFNMIRYYRLQAEIWFNQAKGKK
jgi:hypothetical protein